MRQKIGYVEYRVGILLSYADVLFLSAGKHNNAVQREGNCRPLIFFNTAVIVRFKIAKTRLLIHGVGFKVKTGRIHMRDHNAYTVLCHVFLTDLYKKNIFAPVQKVTLVARFQFFGKTERLKAVFQSKFFSLDRSVALGFRIIQKVFVAFREVVNFFKLRSVGFLVYVFTGIFKFHMYLLSITLIPLIIINKFKLKVKARHNKFFYFFALLIIRNSL